MKRFAIALLAATAIAAPAQAAEVQITTQNPVIELSVFEQIEVEPDMATISTGVQTDADTAVEALRRNSAEMERLVALIRALGIPARDIQTASINLNPRYDYNNRGDQPPRFLGYQASNQVTVKLRDLDRVGEVLDAMVEAGATNINGPQFSIEDDEAAKAQARSNALERGRAQAEEYARLAGYSGVRLLQVAEAIRGSSGPMAKDEAILVSGSRMAAAPPPPVAPGVVSTGVGIALTYEMTR
ncbi:SIMPL domain-containing protein [Qipengyuania sp. XHP0211]|uniref:SIMPL domain-containing protein n=1 Tax=Qipengyuania sp. XHP0211 TaxID=3038079 RepID=UPI00241FF74A|nr:SIMPL domain-containing protein [Qipengyuania sp. XHP0211]MDG5749697.1 SIMPL domain-containing protein [Qipengyuania sp. XHP0211]